MNKKIISLFFFLLFACGLQNIAFAVPAAPDVFDIIQPDRHSFKAQLKGDEWNNWIETDEGHSIQQKGDGFWHYISRFDKDKPVLSTIRAHERPQTGLKKHIRPDKKFMRIPPGLNRESSVESLPSDSGVIGPGFSTAPESSPGSPFNDSSIDPS